MQKEFIPYEQALELKELKFDIPSISGYSYPDSDKLLTQAILYQQAFKWFRDKYGLHNYIYKNPSGANFWGYYTWETGATSPYDSYEDAELACLKKLIEIVKNK